MRSFTRMLLLAALLSPSLLAAPAQTAVDPSGHWEGTIKTPDLDIRIDVDLAKTSKGTLAGTLGQPARGEKGLPLSTVAVEGTAVTFEIKGNSGGTFHGILNADGKSMSGDFISTEGGYSLPFRLTRTGDARIDAPPKGAPIGKEMEGVWNGTLDVNGRALRVVLKMSNQPDGTSTGSLVSIDEGGIELPVLITQKAASLTLDVKATGSSYSGALNAEGTELAGTYTTHGVALPLTFRRATETEGKK